MITRMDASGTTNLSTQHYGRCPCSGEYQRRFVEVRMTVAGKKLVWTDIPQGACSSCGSRIYKAHVLERIEAVFKLRTP